MILLGSPLVPAERLGLVLVEPLPGFVHPGELVLRVDIAGYGRSNQRRRARARLEVGRPLVLFGEAHILRPLGIASLGGRPEPSKRFPLVLRNASSRPLKRPETILPQCHPLLA